MASPYEGEGVSVAAFATAAGLWIVWVQVLSFAAGGYLAGRMRRRSYDSTEHEVDVRDGVHGLLVWATGALLGAFLASASFASAPLATDNGGMSSIAATITESAENIADGGEVTVGDAVGEELTNAEEVRADAARKWGIIAAFVAAASLLVSAAAAFFTAGLGGRHRDQGLIVPFFQRQQWK